MTTHALRTLILVTQTVVLRCWLNISKAWTSHKKRMYMVQVGNSKTNHDDKIWSERSNKEWCILKNGRHQPWNSNNCWLQTWNVSLLRCCHSYQRQWTSCIISVQITLRPSKAMAVDALWLGLDALYFCVNLLYSGLRCPSAVALKLSAPQNL